MTAMEPRTPKARKTAPGDGDLNEVIRSYVRTYVLWHGRTKAAETFGVSRHTLWRCLNCARLGLSLLKTLRRAVGQSPEDIEAATWTMTARRAVARRGAASRHLPESPEDTLPLLCATPLTTVEELARLGRVPAATLRDRLARLRHRGLADSVAHHLGVLGPNPRQRHFPTESGTGGRLNATHTPRSRTPYATSSTASG